MVSLPDSLVTLRKQNNLTQSELASKLGITRSAISMYETGQREPSLEVLEIFADFYNVDMNTLIHGHLSSTGSRIKDRRKQLGISADFVAQNIGVSRATIFRYESGDTKKIPSNILADISKVLKTSPDHLLGLEENNHEKLCLKDFIKKYRAEHDISQRQFAALCGLSNGYISMIERENNPSTGQAPVPTLTALSKIASAMGITLNELFASIEDMPVTLNSPTDFIPVKGTVPIIGKIAAGVPLLAQENIEGYRFINLPHSEEYFFLRVKGDSMINAGITDRSLVLIHKQPYANNGDIVACRVNGDEATLKRYRQQDDMVMLLPENPAYFPQLVPCSAFEDGTAEIIGTARQIVIDL